MREKGTVTASRGPSTVVLWLLPAIFLAASVFLSVRLRDEGMSARRDGESGRSREGLFLAISRNPAYAFGFRNFLADVQWLEAVQVAGARRMREADYDRLALLLKAVNNFDPRFLVPYLLGGLLLADSSRHVGEALSVLERGCAALPNEWRLPFYLGYTRYFSLGDPLEGGRAFEKASRLPDSPPYLPLLASRMFSEGRKPQAALAFLEEMLKEESDPARKEILMRRKLDVIVERDIQDLERAVDAYRLRFGGPPAFLSDLVASGLVRGIPEEPHGGRYLVGPDGEVRSDRVERRLRVFRKK